jgi:hypothetical protein
VLLPAGFAAAITESISMGAVGYTSSVAERELPHRRRLTGVRPAGSFSGREPAHMAGR